MAKNVNFVQQNLLFVTSHQNVNIHKSCHQLQNEINAHFMNIKGNNIITNSHLYVQIIQYFSFVQLIIYLVKYLISNLHFLPVTVATRIGEHLSNPTLPQEVVLHYTDRAPRLGIYSLRAPQGWKPRSRSGVAWPLPEKQAS